MPLSCLAHFCSSVSSSAFRPSSGAGEAQSRAVLLPSLPARPRAPAGLGLVELLRPHRSRCSCVLSLFGLAPGSVELLRPSRLPGPCHLALFCLAPGSVELLRPSWLPIQRLRRWPALAPCPTTSWRRTCLPMTPRVGTLWSRPVALPPGFARPQVPRLAASLVRGPRALSLCAPLSGSSQKFVGRVGWSTRSRCRRKPLASLAWPLRWHRR